MSSTYSPNLAIELMGAGDQAGNWGSTTNTNLGTLIEQAISGYTTQAMADADQTLTMTPGASATARNMSIECTGTLTANRNLIVPSNKKLYFVYNNTTGSYAITVKVSGQTGVSVPNGAKIALVCNGTDVYVATNYMTSPTFANPALIGIPTAPTAPAGTNSTQIATTAFVTAGLQAAYPVGAIYISTVVTNPATLFGFGTWVAYGQGRMLISQDGATYTAGSTGGSATSTIGTTNLPSHTHGVSSITVGNTDLSHTHTYGSANNWGAGSANAFDARNTGSYTTSGASVNMNHNHSLSGTTDATGSGTALTTISPYIAVYMWNRTA